MLLVDWGGFLASGMAAEGRGFLATVTSEDDSCRVPPSFGPFELSAPTQK